MKWSVVLIDQTNKWFWFLIDMRDQVKSKIEIEKWSSKSMCEDVPGDSI